MVECFPFLQLNWWTTDYPCRQFGLLGLVSTLGSHLESYQDVIMSRVPKKGSSAGPTEDVSLFYDSFPGPAFLAYGLNF